MADISHSITTILTNAFSIDKTTRESAEKSLEQLALSNFPELLFKLASELSDESQPVKIRQLSATYIKNSITREDLKEVWVNKMDHSIKDQIKNLILSTLATNFKEVRTAAGIVISGICRVDLPLNEKWPTLISSLCQNSYHENINISLAAIESLGYVCEELSLKSIDANTVDGILSAIITNLANHIDNTDIVKYCLKALFHTVRLAEKNFASPVINFLIFRMK
jgi:importin subunit beta-1